MMSTARAPELVPDNVSSAPSETDTPAASSRSSVGEAISAHSPGVPVKKLNVRFTKKNLDIASYYSGRPKAPVEFVFTKVARWTDFSEMCFANLARLHSFDKKFYRDFDERFVARYGPSLTETLEQNSVHAVIQAGAFAGQVGESTISVSLKERERPVLIGNHARLASLPQLDDNDLLHKVMVLPETEQSPVHHEYLRAIRQLSNSLLANDLRIGYISTYECTRFFNLCYLTGPGYDGVKLVMRISQPIKRSEMVESLVATVLECYYGDPFLNYKRGFEMISETRAEPDLWGVPGANGPVPGRIRWWLVNQRASCNLFACFHNFIGEYYFEPQHGASLGTLYESTNNAPQQQRTCIFKIALLHTPDAAMLDAEASIYEYLFDKRLDTVPQRISYGNVLNQFKVLALRPFGRPMTRQDLNLSSIRRMEAALESLLAKRVCHRDIRLENFFIDFEGRVRIANFGRARLYKNLSDVAKNEERDVLRRIVYERL